MKRSAMRRPADSGRGWPPGAVLALLLSLCLAGCSSKGTVSGKVTYKGEALRQGVVLFLAADGWTGSALISEDGTYRIANLTPGSFKLAVETSADLAPSGRQTKGPPGGKWRPPKDAAVPKEVEEAVRQPLQQVSAPPRLPAKYTKAETSGLTCQVKPGRQNHDIDLQ
jgi:hypothetical protein